MAIDLNKIMQNIFNTIYQNQNLCKLLYYNELNPYSMPDLTDTSVIYTDELNRKLYPYPFAPDVTEEQKTFISVLFDDIQYENNTYFKPGKIDFIVCSHIYNWDLNVGDTDIHLRPFEIINEIDKSFNRQSNSGTVGKDLFKYIKPIKINDKFSGMVYCLKFWEVS